MAWASVFEVLELTGVTVTIAQLDYAQGVIDLFSGVTEDAWANLSGRNLRLLNAATAYQAVWMAAQVDVITRTDVSELDQDGVKFTPAHQDALLLAPLAKRCLDRLSWHGARTLRVNPRGCHEGRYSDIGAWQAAWLRDADYDPRWAAL